jgi:hypothetical protein
MNNWIYQSQPINSIEDLPHSEVLYGFVYIITNLKDGRIYVGKKALYTTRKKALAKKDRSTDRRKKTYARITRESDWKKYWGSCKELQEDIQTQGPQWFKREILEVACSVKYLSYLELKYQLQYDVLGRKSYNGNILGRYYSRDMENKCFTNVIEVSTQAVTG